METTINQLATYANSAKTNKTKSNHAFKSLFDALTDEQRNNNWFELAQLYKTFLPPIPAKPKTIFDMCQKFVGKKDVRYYLNNVYVDEQQRLVASDGHKLIRSIQSTNLSSGYYDKAKNRLDDSTRYPNVQRVFDMAYKGSHAEIINKVIDVTQPVLVYDLTVILKDGEEQQITVQKQYLDLAEQCLKSNYSLLFKDSKTAIVMYDDEIEVLTMPYIKKQGN